MLLRSSRVGWRWGHEFLSVVSSNSSNENTESIINGPTVRDIAVCGGQLRVLHSPPHRHRLALLPGDGLFSPVGSSVNQIGMCEPSGVTNEQYLNPGPLRVHTALLAEELRGWWKKLVSVVGCSNDERLHTDMCVSHNSKDCLHLKLGAGCAWVGVRAKAEAEACGDGEIVGRLEPVVAQ